jgi:type VI secretion system Hcp family effector
MAWAMFCKIDGIEGSNTVVNHRSEIEVLKFDYFVSHPVTGGEGVGSHHHSDVTIEKASDKSSGKLMQHSISGRVLSKVELKFYRQTHGGEEGCYCTVTLKNAIVSNWHASADQSDTTHPGIRETVSFAFSEIKLEGPEMDVAEDTYRELTAPNRGG